MLKILSLSLLLLSPLLGEITAPQIMATARHATTLNNIEFKGKLKGKHSTPIVLKMLGNDLQIWYDKDNVSKGIRVILAEKQSALYDITGDKVSEFPAQHFGASIEGTDFTYEDLSMRFLYWSQSELLGKESVKTQDCYVVRAFNPTKSGNYKYVDLWIHNKAFAVMKMQGYDANNQHIKTLEAADLMNVNDKIMMKKMKVKTIQNNRTVSNSYLILENPEGLKKIGPKKRR